MQNLSLTVFDPLEIPVSPFLPPLKVLLPGAMSDSCSPFPSLGVIDQLAGSFSLPTTHGIHENIKQYCSTADPYY